MNIADFDYLREDPTNVFIDHILSNQEERLFLSTLLHEDTIADYIQASADGYVVTLTQKIYSKWISEKDKNVHLYVLERDNKYRVTTFPYVSPHSDKGYDITMFPHFDVHTNTEYIAFTLLRCINEPNGLYNYREADVLNLSEAFLNETKSIDWMKQASTKLFTRFVIAEEKRDGIIALASVKDKGYEKEEPRRIKFYSADIFELW